MSLVIAGLFAAVLGQVPNTEALKGAKEWRKASQAVMLNLPADPKASQAEIRTRLRLVIRKGDLVIQAEKTFIEQNLKAILVKSLKMPEDKRHPELENLEKMNDLQSRTCALYLVKFGGQSEEVPECAKLPPRFQTWQQK